MKIRFDAEGIDLGYRVLPQHEIRGLTIETDVRRGYLVKFLTVLAVGVGILGLFAALASERPGLGLLYLAGYLLVLYVKGHGLVEAVSDQEKFHTLWAVVPEGRVRILSVGDAAFAEKVRTTIDHVRLKPSAGAYEADPAWQTIEEVPGRPAVGRET